MGYKTINTSLDVTHYLQNNSKWGSKKLGTNGYTIGQIGCALTSAAMIEQVTPGTLYDDHNMTEESINWSKLPFHTYSRVSFKKTIADKFSQIFSEVVQKNNPIIIHGDDGKSSIYSTHFVVVYGFRGTVAIDTDGHIMSASDETNFAQFKVYDPSTVDGYGNSTDVKSFMTRFPLQTLRVPSDK